MSCVFCSQLHPITSHYIIYGFLDYGYIPLRVGLKIEKYPKPNASHDHYPVFKWLLDGGPTIFSDTPILHHIAIFHSYFRNISQKNHTYIQNYPKMFIVFHEISKKHTSSYIPIIHIPLKNLEILLYIYICIYIYIYR